LLKYFYKAIPLLWYTNPLKSINLKKKNNYEVLLDAKIQIREDRIAKLAFKPLR